MNREEQLDWLQDLHDLDGEDIIIVLRMAERVRQGTGFPKTPGDKVKKCDGTEKFYSADELLSELDLWVGPSPSKKYIDIECVFGDNMDKLMNSTAIPTPCVEVYSTPISSLGSLRCTANSPEWNMPLNGWVPTVCNTGKKKEDSNMNYNSIEQQTRDHLINRTHGISRDKLYNSDLQDAYNINGPKNPKTIKELRERIANGWLKIDGEDDDRAEYWLDSIYMEDPSKPKDRKGYDAAVKKIAEDKKRTIDVIYTSAPADALKALQEFESTSYLPN